MGSIPIFQIQGGPVVLVPNLATQKVHAPIPIAPKPAVTQPQPVLKPSRNKPQTILPATCKNNILVNSDALLNIINDQSTPKSFLTQHKGTTKSNISEKDVPCTSKNEVIVISDNSSINNSGTSSDDKLSCPSATSHLSELSIDSSELSSGKQYSSEETDEVLSQVKKLNEDDMKIVNLIANIAENTSDNNDIRSNYVDDNISIIKNSKSGSNSNNNYNDTKVLNKNTHDLNKKNVEGKEIRNNNDIFDAGTVKTSYKSLVDTKGFSTNSYRFTDTEPVTTMANSDTNNWSIVKNMLINTMKAKKEKKAPTKNSSDNDKKVNPISSFLQLQNNNLTVKNSEILSKPKELINIGPLNKIVIDSNFKNKETSLETVAVSSGSLPGKNNKSKLKNVGFLLNETPSKSTEISLMNSGLMRPSNGTAHTMISSTNHIENNFIDNFIETSAFNSQQTLNQIPIQSENTEMKKTITANICVCTTSTVNVTTTSNRISDLLMTPCVDKSLDELVNNSQQYSLSELDWLDLQPSSLLSARLLDDNKTQDKDIFLTTFVDTPKTPKSGAGAYGLGMNFEDLFAGSSFDL